MEDLLEAKKILLNERIQLCSTLVAINPITEIEEYKGVQERIRAINDELRELNEEMHAFEVNKAAREKEAKVSLLELRKLEAEAEGSELDVTRKKTEMENRAIIDKIEQDRARAEERLKRKELETYDERLELERKKTALEVAKTVVTAVGSVITTALVMFGTLMNVRACGEESSKGGFLHKERMDVVKMSPKPRI